MIPWLILYVLISHNIPNIKQDSVQFQFHDKSSDKYTTTDTQVKKTVQIEVRPYEMPLHFKYENSARIKEKKKNFSAAQLVQRIWAT